MADVHLIAVSSPPRLPDRYREQPCHGQSPGNNEPLQQAQHPQPNIIRLSDPSSTNENSSTAKSSYVPVYSKLLYNLIHKYIPFTFIILFCITGITILIYTFSLRSPLPRKLMTGLASSFGLLIAFWMLLGIIGYFRRRVVMGKRWNRGGHANVCGRSAARGEWFHEHDLEWGSRKSQAGTVVRGNGGVEMVRGELSVKSHDERALGWESGKEWCIRKCCGWKSVTKEEPAIIKRASSVADRPRERGRLRRPISEDEHRARIMPKQISDAKKERIRANGAGKAYPPPLPLPNATQDHDRWIKIPVRQPRESRRRHGLDIGQVIVHENALPTHTTPAPLDGYKLSADQDMIVGYMASDPKEYWEKDFVPKMNGVKEDRRSRSADNVRSKYHMAKATRSPLGSKVDTKASIVKPKKQNLTRYANIREIPPFETTERTKKLLPSIQHQRNTHRKMLSRTNTLPTRRGINLFPPQQPRLKRSNTRLDVRAVPKPLNIEKSQVGGLAMVGSDGERTKQLTNLFQFEEDQNINGCLRSYDANNMDLVKLSYGLTTERDVEMALTRNAITFATPQLKDQTQALLRHYPALSAKSLEEQKKVDLDRFEQEDEDSLPIQPPRGMIGTDDSLDSQMRTETSTLQSPNFIRGETQASTKVDFKGRSDWELQQIPEQSKNVDRLMSSRHDYPQPILGHFFHRRDLEERENRDCERQQEEQELQKQEPDKQFLGENMLFTPQKRFRDVVSCHYEATPSQMKGRRDEPSTRGSDSRMIITDNNSMPLSCSQALHNGIDLELSDKSESLNNEDKALSLRRLSTPSMIDFDTPNLPYMFLISSRAMSSHNLMLNPTLVKTVEERVEDVEEDVSGFSDGFDGRDPNPLISRPVSACSALMPQGSRRWYDGEESSSIADMELLNKRVVSFVNLPEVVVSNHDFGNIWSSIDHSSRANKAWSPVHVIQQPVSVEEQDVSGREPSASSKREAIRHSMLEENSKSQIVLVDKMDEKRLIKVAKQDVSDGKDNSIQRRRVIAKGAVEEDLTSQSNTIEGIMGATSGPQNGIVKKGNDKRLTKKLIIEKDVDWHGRDSHLADVAELYAIDSQFLERGWRESAGSS